MKKVICISILSVVLATSCADKAKETQTATTTVAPAETKEPAAPTAAVSQKAKDEAKAKIEDIRKKVVSKEMTIGEAAQQYSDDPGSNKVGGRYNGIARGQFVPEFEKAAFALKPGEISEVFETQYGYHFLQLMDRRGDIVDVSHVLVIPK
ncbi:MAG TPA: peptidylprolyl isomerase [Bacteroidia bacterium]|nr:peptidylprolyl isomerase [Bacteroidia bacterium]